jgi:1,4-alpha-glucan branching enzyme
VVSFVRRGKNPADYAVCAFNFTPTPRYGYRIGVPGAAALAVALNTDADRFGGSNLGPIQVVPPEPTPWQGQPCSVALTLPPLGALLLQPVSAV